MTTLIHADGVSKTYHTNGVPVRALHSVSLEISKGEFVMCAGPSGSGKSTLLNLIAGLDLPTEGTVTVNGHALGKLTANELAEFRLHTIGFVFQAYNLIPVLTALENVEYVMLLQGVSKKERRERAKDVLIRVGLEKNITSRPHQMSGGQQQRVAIARAIAARPPLVFADEPTANLDSQTGSDLVDLFRELASAYETTFILASHDPMVLGKAKRLIRLSDGRVTEDTILQHP